jgi:hypothetical protein
MPGCRPLCSKLNSTRHCCILKAQCSRPPHFAPALTFFYLQLSHAHFPWTPSSLTRAMASLHPFVLPLPHQSRGIPTSFILFCLTRAKAFPHYLALFLSYQSRGILHPCIKCCGIPTCLNPYIPTCLHPSRCTHLYDGIPTFLRPFPSLARLWHPYIPASLHPCTPVAALT